MSKTTMVSLTDEELVLLDGQCAEKIQVKVDEAKERLRQASLLPEDTPHRDFIAQVIAEAVAKGELIFRWERLRYCPVCDRNAGYAPYKRNTRYHNKGDPNYKKPLTFPGYELAQRFVVVRGRATLGCCHECWESIKPILANVLRNVKAEIPEAITGEPPRYKKHERRRCKKCGWEGHEGEMGRLPCLMGGGTYPGVCPQCGARSLPLGPTVFDIPKGFVVAEVPGAAG